jgi:hypothetical protein
MHPLVGALFLDISHGVVFNGGLFAPLKSKNAIMGDLETASELYNASTQSYFDWVKQMLSLSFAGLPALVALQGNYTPDTDLARWLLWGTFGSLAASVVASAIVLQGQHQTQRRLSRQYAEAFQEAEKNTLHATDRLWREQGPPLPARIAGRCLPWVLSLAVLFLFAFSVTNSYPKGKPKNADREVSVPWGCRFLVH